MKKRALITGITGQDGGFLAELLLEKDYEVYGIERRSSTPARINCEHLEGKITFINGDLTDQNSIVRCLKKSKPDEVYNLAAQSFVGESWNTPEQTGDVTGLGALRMLEAIREYGKEIKFYQASTSEMFGRMEKFANEDTPFYPRSPYGVAKLYAHWITKNYREAYNIFACNGILFNHESPRRGETFVTKKIVSALCKIKEGKQKKLFLGNLSSKRDWGHAKDYCYAMWKMLQKKTPDDYVIATGKQYSIKQFINLTAKKLKLKIKWKGKGNKEKGYNSLGEPIIECDKNYIRPLDVNTLLGDARKARKELKWRPIVKIDSLIEEMINSEYQNFNGIK